MYITLRTPLSFHVIRGYVGWVLGKTKWNGLGANY